MSGDELDYGEVMDQYYTKAEKAGEKYPDFAWLDLDGVWWPNPHYKGTPGPHPEDSNVFHPAKGLTARERYLESKKK